VADSGLRTVHATVTEHYDRLSPGQRRVIDRLLVDTRYAAVVSAPELAVEVGVSESTVTRAAQALGFAGYPDLQARLRQRFVDGVPERVEASLADLGDTPQAAAIRVMLEDAESVRATAEDLDPAALGAIVDLLIRARHVYVFGARGSFGLALDVQADNGTQYELFYGRQSTVMRGDASFAPTSVDVEYLHVGGTAPLDEELRVKPYVLGGLGITRFSPDPARGRENTRFSASLGAGLRVPFSTHFSLRLEARGFVTLVDPNTAFFCRSDQTGLLCRVRSRGSTFIQYDLLAGAALTF